MVAAQKVDYLVRHHFRLGGIHIYLVQYGDDLKPVVHSKIEVRNGLRLDALGCVHDQQGTFTGSYGTGDLVREVHVPRSINEVEDVFLTLVEVLHLDRVALDGDPFLLLKVHIVQDLGLHIPGRQGLGKLEQPVGKRALAVVDMGYDAEVPDMFHNCKNNQIVVHLKD